MFVSTASKVARLPFALVSLALLTLVLMLNYRQVLGFGYVWDDLQLFIYSSDLRGDTLRIQRIFEPVLSMTTYFRPAVMLSFVLEFVAGGVDSTVSHAVNLALFAANTLLVWSLAWWVLARHEPRTRGGFAFVAAAVYLLSPVQIESMAWVAGRFDLMCTFFVLLSLVCALCVRRVFVAALGAGMFFYLGLMSKEMAVTLPAVLLLMLWALADPGTRPSFVRHLRAVWSNARERLVFTGIAVAFVAYLVTRVIAIPQFIHADSGVMGQLTALKWPALIGHAILFYLRQIFLPFIDISPLHNFEVARLSLSQLWLGVVVLVAVSAGVAWASLVRRQTWAIWAAMVLVALSPVLHLIPLTIGNSIGHDRFLALPLALVCIGLADTAAQALDGKGEAVRRFRGYAMVLLLLWCVAAVVNVRVTLPLWQNDLTLWKWAFEKDPCDEKARHLFLNAAIRSGHHDLYEKHARPPASGDDMLQHAYFLLRKNQPHEALDLLLRRLQDAGSPLKHSYYPPHFQISLMAEAYIALRDFPNALEAADATTRIAPDYPPAYLLKSFALSGLGRRVEADAAFAIAVRHLEGVASDEAHQLRKAFLEQL